MTRRYAARSDASFTPADECRPVGPLGMDVLDDLSPTEHETGLLDARGNRLVRIETRRPIGFTHFGDDE